MSNDDIIRSWKDDEYRENLSEDQRADLPEDPAGDVELTDSDLGDVSGGAASYTIDSSCPTFADTVCNGTCASFSVGCCEQAVMQSA